MRNERGQATIDYVALVAVLAIVLAAAAALVSGGTAGVANAVVGQVRHALCIVTGGACPAERRSPCVVASERDARHVSGTILVVRLDGDRYVLRERLSDGTVRLTLAHRAGAGVELGLGARAQVTIHGRKAGIQDELRGGGQGILGYGEVYIARDDREAGEILRAITHRIPLVGGRGPRPRERFVEGGARGLARIGIGSLAGGASLEGVSDTILGGRRDERTGAVTITLSAGKAGWAMLSAFLAGPSASRERNVAIGLTLDRDHRPSELSLTATGSLAAGAALPPGLAALLKVGDRDDPQMHLKGRRWELAARLSLRDPDVAAAWAAFRHNPTDIGAIRALAGAVRTRAQLDVRTYAVRSESSGAAVGLGALLRIGAEIDHTTDRARLLAAATRPPGGLWEQRSDCVAA